MIYFLRAAPWQYQGFDSSAYKRELRAIHDRIEKEGSFVAHMHRFLIEAVKT